MRKQSSDEEVQNIAKALIKSWKKLLGEVLSEDAALLHSYLNGNDQLHVVLQMVQRRRRRTVPLWGLHPPPKTLAAVRKGLSHWWCHNPVTYQRCWRSWFPPLSSSTKTSDESSGTPTSPGLPPPVPSFPPAPITTGNVRNKCRELLVAALQTGGEQIIWSLIHASIFCLCSQTGLFWTALDQSAVTGAETAALGPHH